MLVASSNVGNNHKRRSVIDISHGITIERLPSGKEGLEPFDVMRIASQLI
jgi:hypothetical protein